MDVIKIYSSKRKYFFLLLGSLAFVAGGIFLLSKSDPDEVIIAWLCTLLFGAAALVFIFQLFDKRPRIIFDDKGVTDRTLGVGVIPWSEITGAYVRSIKGNDFVCLELIDEEKYTKHLSKAKRALTAGNKALGFTALNLNLSGVAADTEQVFEHVVKRIELS